MKITEEWPELQTFQHEETAVQRYPSWTLYIRENLYEQTLGFWACQLHIPTTLRSMWFLENVKMLFLLTHIHGIHLNICNDVNENLTKGLQRNRGPPTHYSLDNEAMSDCFPICTVWIPWLFSYVLITSCWLIRGWRHHCQISFKYSLGHVCWYVNIAARDFYSRMSIIMIFTL